MTDQEKNFISRIQQRASDVLAIRAQLASEIALYNAEGFGTEITDADLQEVAAFAHITQSEMWNCITAFQTVLNALGDDVSGQAVNLIKMRG